MLRSSKILLKRFLNMGFQWFSVTLCYYGLSFASTSLSDDVFTNFLLRYRFEIMIKIIKRLRIYLIKITKLLHFAINL